MGISVKNKDGKWEDLTLKIINNKDDDKGDKDDDENEDEEGDSADKEEGKMNKFWSVLVILNLQKAGLVDNQLPARKTAVSTRKTVVK